MTFQFAILGRRLLLLSLAMLAMNSCRVESRAIAQAVPNAQPYVLRGQVAGVRAGPLSGDGRTFVAELHNGIRVWDSQTLEPIGNLLEHADYIYARLSADGTTAATFGHQEIRFWDVKTSTLRFTLPVATKQICAVELNPSGSAFGSFNLEDTHTLNVWRAAPHRAEAVWHRRFESSIGSIDFSPGGDAILLRENGGFCRLIDSKSGIDLAPPFAKAEDYAPLPHKASFDKTGKQVLVPLKHAFQTYNVATGKLIRETKIEEDVEVDSAEYSADASVITVLTTIRLEEGPVLQFDAVTAKLIRRFGDGVFKCRMSPKNRWAVCSSGKGDAIEVWDLALEKKVQTLGPSDHDVAHMDVNGQYVTLRSAPDIISSYRLAAGSE